MAITAISTGTRILGAANNKTANTGFSTTNPWGALTPAAANDVAIVVVAIDNTGTTDGSGGTEVTSFTDSRGNTYTKIAEFRNGQGSANAGATVAVFKSKLTNTYQIGDSVTLDLGNSVTAKAWGSQLFSVASGKDLTLVAGSTQTRADDGADTGSMTISGLSSKEYLFFRAVAREDTSANGTLTTNYSRIVITGTSGGGGAANMSAWGEFRIVTGTGETSDPTNSNADSASLFLAFEETSEGYNMTAASGSYTLTGTAADLKRALLLSAAAGSYIITGTEPILRVKMPVDSGSYALNGTAVNLKADRKLAAASGAYNLTGSNVNFVPGRGTLVAQGGVYTLTGSDVTLKVTMPAASGSYVLTGSAVTLTKAGGALVMQAGHSQTELVTNGTFDSNVSGWSDLFGGGAVITWQSTGRMRVARSTTGYQLATQSPASQPQGTYVVEADFYNPDGLTVVVGMLAALPYTTSNATSGRLRAEVTGSGNPDVILGIDDGSGSNGQYVEFDNVTIHRVDYALTGTDVTFRIGKTLVAASGSYVLTGSNVSLKHAAILAAASGSYVLSGTVASLKATHLLSAAGGSYLLTGTDAGLRPGRTLSAASGAYALDGTAVAFRQAKALAAAAGAYSLTGSAVTLKRALILAAASGAYTLTGTAALLRLGKAMTAASGAYVLTGSTVSMRFGKTLSAASGSYVLTGTSVRYVLTGEHVPGGGGSGPRVVAFLV